MSSPDLDVQYDDWHAVHNHMGRSLHVYGTCTVRGGGVHVGLEPRDEQGFNPAMLMLSFRITPTGESPSQHSVEYRQNWDENGIQYKEVGFEVLGPFAAQAPPTLRIEDVY